MPMKSRLYTLVIEDNVPTIKEIAVVGTANLGGITYWLVPAIEPVPELSQAAANLAAAIPKPPERIAQGYVAPPAGDIEQQIMWAAAANPTMSASALGRRLGTSAWMVSKTLRDNGLEAPADKVRRRFEEALLDAGDKGVSPHQLAGLAKSHGQRAGPVIKSMLHHKTVKRLINGNWCLM